jgi:putative sigma-54 modulation protein
MIEHIDITGKKIVLSEPLKRYIQKKIGRLDRFVSRHARKTVHGEVIIREVNESHGNKYEAEAVLVLPDQQIVAKDSTMNMFAAVDIVEAKLKAQLKKIKDEQVSEKRGHRMNVLKRFYLQREQEIVQDEAL